MSVCIFTTYTHDNTPTYIYLCIYVCMLYIKSTYLFLRQLEQNVIIY